jgi:hypothetical protein
MLRLILLLIPWMRPASELEACVRFWQQELGVVGWRISVEVVHRERLSDRTVGHIDTDELTRTAVIRVLHARDSDLPLEQARADQKLTIAHEMVHLKRLVCDRSPDWRDEASTNEQTVRLLRKHRRLMELSVLEE